jgi:hypothetical protein
VADGYSGLQVIDITNPTSPQIVGSLNTPGVAIDVAISGSHAYVADGVSGLQVIDITTPASLQIVGSVNTPENAVGVAIFGSHAYVGDGWSGLQVIDITTPESPQTIGSVGTPGRAHGVAIFGSLVYLAAGDSGLQVAPSQCEEGVSVYLVNLRVERVGHHAIVRWSIAMSRAHVGFRVWRVAPVAVRTLLGEAVLSGQDSYEFTDTAPPPGPADYWLQEVTTDSSDNWYGPAHLSAAVEPVVLSVSQNQPNPFNPRTTFKYTLPYAGRVRLAVYDLRGSRLATLVEAEVPAGDWSVEWDGLDARGLAVPSGVYLAKLEAPTGIRTVKMTVTR